jgi:5-methylcytosine-specific restriction endonuclease McrA
MSSRHSIPTQLRERVFREKGTRCTYCSRSLLSLPARDRTLDHVKHVHLGGKNTLTNLVPCCRQCNSMRHMMGPAEFAEYRKRRHSRRYVLQRRKDAQAYYQQQREQRSKGAKKGWRTRRAKAKA